MEKSYIVYRVVETVQWTRIVANSPDDAREQGQQTPSKFRWEFQSSAEEVTDVLESD